MLEGIDYYPKKSKKKLKLKWRMPLLLALMAGIFWYLNQKYNTKKVKKAPVLIVISKGEKEQKETVSTVIIDNHSLLGSNSNKNIVNPKALDEAIHNYTNKHQ
ncbi:conserved hypothetical protein [Abyssogena phaseoliformis symbiont OG214]|uniref:hypothetical protein n=1 Tax=Abyssogena phaseoliformis symbiont TaxID=596095 RepID=UPI0019154B55|nr:hypothetical protein [Abyssogena phaseoliformis symbiont]BBB22462.1 conserved hypothetical protein [Abyssogena phaseoliformis symbiont OG214]